jgi:hypothetical protein
MFKWITNIFEWFCGLWRKLPQGVKDKIIDIIVEGFDMFLRGYFKDSAMRSANE